MTASGCRRVLVIEAEDQEGRAFVQVAVRADIAINGGELGKPQLMKILYSIFAVLSALFF